MACIICQVGNYKEGRATMPLRKDGKVVLITDIPALVCDNCEDFIINPEVSSVLFEAAKELLKPGEQNVTISYKELGKVAA
jgi:YgiT-type zinc finger domain-containing protein